MKLVEKDVAFNVRVFLVLDADGETPATGLVNGDFTSKRFAIGTDAFAGLSSSITEAENGWYTVPFTSGEADAYGDVQLHLAAPGIKTVDRVVAQVVGFDPESPLATDADLGQLQADVDDIQSRLPATLLSGLMRSSVSNMEFGVVTGDAVGPTAVAEIQAGLATSTALADVQSDVTNILSDTGNIQTRIPVALVGGRIDASISASGMTSDAVGAIWAAALTSVRSGGTVGEAVSLILGLVQGNFVIDSVSHSGNDMTTARVRLFDDAADVAAAVDDAPLGDDGEFAAYQITVTFSSAGKINTYKSEKLVMP